MTWQRQEARRAGHFVPHDLTHYAVERELGFQRGFFGLIAEGWEIEDTTGKGARGRLPAESIVVEQLVGLFDVQRADGVEWPLEELNRQAAASAQRAGISPRPLDAQELERVRARLAELLDEWSRLGRGESMELLFAPGGPLPECGRGEPGRPEA